MKTRPCVALCIPNGLCPKPTPKKAILHAPLTKDVVGSGCHATFTCSVTQVGSEGVMTQGPCGDVGRERLASVTTRLAKRTGDTPHLGGDSIPTLTHTSGDSVISDYDVEALWPSGVAMTRLTMTRLTPSHLSCVTRRADDFCHKSILREMKAFRRICVLSDQNSLIFSVIS